MNNVNRAVDDLAAAILESDVYRTYRTELDKVKQVPGLKSQIDEFRRRNFALQSSADNWTEWKRNMRISGQTRLWQIFWRQSLICAE